MHGLLRVQSDGGRTNGFRSAGNGAYGGKDDATRTNWKAPRGLHEQLAWQAGLRAEAADSSVRNEALDLVGEIVSAIRMQERIVTSRPSAAAIREKRRLAARVSALAAREAGTRG